MNTTAATTSPRPSPTTAPGVAASSLANEHARLLRDVRRRADSVLVLLSQTRSWPHAELQTLTLTLTLTRYPHTSVARQAADKEASLYPHGAPTPVAELTTEHLLLHRLTPRLDLADAVPCSGADLRELLEQLLRVFEQHLVQEQAVLAALPEAPDPVPSVPTTDDSDFLPSGG